MVKGSLNPEQTKALTSFLLDVAKGLMLGGAGLAGVNPSGSKLITITTSVVMSLLLLRFALNLLKETK